MPLIHGSWAFAWPKLAAQKLPQPSQGGAGGASEDESPIIALQWVVSIATCYLILTIHDWQLTEPFPAAVLSASLITALVLQRSPGEILNKHATHVAVLLVDTVLIVAAITSAERIPWDLLLLFFVCVIIAAEGESIIQIGVGCVLVSFIFVGLLTAEPVHVLLENPLVVIRVPFMFGISIFYGYLANEVKRERRQRRKLQESVRLKRQIAAGIAHDIKTPLNVIMGHAELMAGENDSRVANSASCIRRNADEVAKLLSDFLLISKLEKGRLCPGNTDLIQLNGIAAEVVDQQTVIAREKNIRISLELETGLKLVSGDSNDIQRALANLVSNAIKFTPPGGQVIVRSRNGKDEVALEVEDSGPGISAGDLPHLFTEYRRLRTAEKTVGTGLGLFIVKTIVDAHDGVINVSSQPDLGSIFSIRLPIAKDASHVR